MNTNNIKDFFSTPQPLIKKMVDKIEDIRTIKHILEPSAGSGNLVDYLQDLKGDHKSKIDNYSFNSNLKYNIDCIEIDSNLRHILNGKNYRVIHDDFLTFNSFKKYSLIFANFPFSNGVKHVLKALQIIQNGGELVCLINANTLKNECSNERKILVEKLKELNADIEFIQDGFINADRKTNVEVALIHVNIKDNLNNSFILDNLKQEEIIRKQQEQQNNNLINGDFIKGIVESYNFEIKAGLKFISEYRNLDKIVNNSFTDDKLLFPILNLQIDKPEQYSPETSNLENDYIKSIRLKYWKALFSNDKFTKQLTTNLLQEFRSKIEDLKEYDFSLFNIKEIQLQISKQMTQGIKDTVLNLFNEFTYQHSYHSEFSKNILHYNGWKTNKAEKVNKKIIMMLNAFDRWDGRLQIDYYSFREKIQDIENIFDYLDDNKTNHIDLKQALAEAQAKGQTKKIETKYFLIDVYKKGTTHITFRDKELLKKFNIFGGLNKGFLPPSYGDIEYKDMNQQEKETIKEFEGEKEYNKTVQNKEYYIYNPDNIKLLT